MTFDIKKSKIYIMYALLATIPNTKYSNNRIERTEEISQ